MGSQPCLQCQESQESQEYQLRYPDITPKRRRKRLYVDEEELRIEKERNMAKKMTALNVFYDQGRAAQVLLNEHGLNYPLVMNISIISSELESVEKLSMLHCPMLLKLNLRDNHVVNFGILKKANFNMLRTANLGKYFFKLEKNLANNIYFTKFLPHLNRLDLSESKVVIDIKPISQIISQNKQIVVYCDEGKKHHFSFIREMSRGNEQR